MQVDDRAFAAPDEAAAEDDVRGEAGSPVLRVDVGENRVELQLIDDRQHALVRVEAGRPEEVGPLADDLGDCAGAILDLLPYLVVRSSVSRGCVIV